MKNFKAFQLLLVFVAMALFFASCDKEEDEPTPTSITIDSFSKTIDENPAVGFSLGSVVATTNRGTITYSLTDQNPAGAMAINATSGELTVADASKFDFETHPALTAAVTASAEGITETASVSITLNDVDEVDAGTMVLVWETTNPSQTVAIPSHSTLGIDAMVDWGDGTITTVTSGNPFHTYADAGMHEIKISGDYPGFRFGSSSGLREVKSWGGMKLKSLEWAFRWTDGLKITATDAPDLSQVTDASAMFGNSKNFSADLSNWDMSNVTDLSSAFNSTTNFNSDLSKWDVSNVTTLAFAFLFSDNFNGNADGWNTGNVASLEDAFKNTSDFQDDISSWNTSNVTTIEGFASYNFGVSGARFNQDVSNWDVGKVSNFTFAFASNSDFNQDLSGWDVSSATSMKGMFSGTAVNFDVSGWDVSKVTDMSRMFSGAPNFNQSIMSWDMNLVTTVNGMFQNTKSYNQPMNNFSLPNCTDVEKMFWLSSFNASVSNWSFPKVTSLKDVFNGTTEFNQNLSTWDVSKVESFVAMFQDAEKFNRPLSGWDMSSATNLGSMFLGTKVFDQPLNSWNTEKVTVLSGMFNKAEAFNQPLNSWDVSKVTLFSLMFWDAKAFNQSLGAWDLSSATDMGTFFTFANAMTVANYDATLIGWAGNASTPDNITLGANGQQYSDSGEVARNKLVNDKGWTISGDSKQ